MRSFICKLILLSICGALISLAEDVPMTEVEEQAEAPAEELVSTLKAVADRKPAPEAAATAEQARETEPPERVA